LEFQLTVTLAGAMAAGFFFGHFGADARFLGNRGDCSDQWA
jgi:hypothetical protein